MVHKYCPEPVEAPAEIPGMDEEIDFAGAGLCCDDDFEVPGESFVDDFEIPGIEFDAPQPKEKSSDDESLIARFRRWLNIIPVKRIDEIKSELLAANPGLSDFELHKLAVSKAAHDEKKSKLAHERSVSDENACRLLLYQYFEFDDKEALDIYFGFQRTIIERQCLSDRGGAERRLNNMKRAVDICSSHYKRTRGSVASVVETFLRPPDRALVSSAPAPSTQALIEKLDRSDVSAPIRTAADFISAITEDLSREPDQVRQRHCSDLAAQLMSAVNVTAALLKVAPDNAVFSAKQNSRHPIECMHEMLRSTGVDDAMISRYLRQWTQVQNVSQENVDRALAAIFRLQESETVRREFSALQREEVEAALAYGVDPTSSAVMHAVTEFVQNEDFEAVLEEAIASVGPAPASSKRKRTEQASEIRTATARSLERCSRAYLAPFFRAPAGAHHFERECANGVKCVCLALMTPFPTLGNHMGGTAAFNTAGNGTSGTGTASQALHPKEPLVSETEPTQALPSSVGRHNQGFIGREFLKPSQMATLLESNKLPAVQQLCLLCNRYATTFLYYDYMRKSTLSSASTRLEILHDHTVLIDQEGEYDHSACLLTTTPNRPHTGIVGPFIGWSASHYRFSKTRVGNAILPCVVECAALDFQPASVSATPI